MAYKLEPGIKRKEKAAARPSRQRTPEIKSKAKQDEASSSREEAIAALAEKYDVPTLIRRMERAALRTQDHLLTEKYRAMGWPRYRKIILGYRDAALTNMPKSAQGHFHKYAARLVNLASGEYRMSTKPNRSRFKKLQQANSTKGIAHRTDLHAALEAEGITMKGEQDGTTRRTVGF